MWPLLMGTECRLHVMASLDYGVYDIIPAPASNCKLQMQPLQYTALGDRKWVCMNAGPLSKPKVQWEAGGINQPPR